MCVNVECAWCVFGGCGRCVRSDLFDETGLCAVKSDDTLRKYDMMIVCWVCV